MDLQLYNWVDKKLIEINKADTFLKYFKDIELFKGFDCYYLTNKMKGIGLVADVNYIVNTIHLYSDGYEASKEFQDPLPWNLKFFFGQDKIRGLLGKPSKSGGGEKVLYIGYINNWDKYYFDNYALHFQYSADNKKIELISISSLNLENYFNSEQQ